MKHWVGMVVMLLGLASTVVAAPRGELPQPELRERPISTNEPVDFAFLRKKADAMAARQHSSFRLHQIDTLLEFRAEKPRITQANLYYSRPAAGPTRSGWEVLQVGIYTPVEHDPGRWSPGNISGSTGTFDDPRPDPAPANIIAPEEAIARLHRGTMTSPSGGGPESLPKDRSQWRLSVKLIRIGAKYLVATPGWRPPGDPRLIPSSGIDESRNSSPTFFSEEPFFVKTAPSGKWVWWTVVQHVVRGRRYEYIYMDAVTGKPTSHCAEQPRPYTPLISVPCAPPR